MLTAFWDSDWAGDPDNSAPPLVLAYFLAPISSHGLLKKQSTISHSSMKAEYHALVLTVTEVRLFSYLFRELVFALNSISLLYYDNVSPLHMVANPIFHTCTYISQRIIISCEILVVQKALAFWCTPSNEQLVDIFTKSLMRDQFSYLVSNIPLLTQPFCSRGHKRDNHQESTKNI